LNGDWRQWTLLPYPGGWIQLFEGFLESVEATTSVGVILL
jgi:hypothetical protein